MNNALITYHDKTQDIFASISKDTHEHFAKTYGLDWVYEHEDTVNPDCYMNKVRLTLRELKAGRPIVVWADVDIVFNKQLEPDFIDKALETRPTAMATEPMGLCDCFYIVKNTEDTVKLFETWLFLDKVKGFNHDQETFLILNRNFPKITKLTSGIQMSKIGITFISNPASIGKHFYARTRGIGTTVDMKAYKTQWYHEIVTAP